jgi:prolyl-tRNA editing enzyme YbaK/EbsC (Cys-tRNA(Pro) deacylase)
VHPNAAHVQQVLTSAGASGAVIETQDTARTADEAAAALGCEVGAIVKALIFSADGDPVLVLASGAHRVDTAAVARHLGVHAVRQASPAVVREATGFAIGGVAPVGHPRPLRTLLDSALGRHDRIWAAAGTPNAVFPTTYSELLRLTMGTAADLAAGPAPAPPAGQ